MPAQENTANLSVCTLVHVCAGVWCVCARAHVPHVEARGQSQVSLFRRCPPLVKTESLARLELAK